MDRARCANCGQLLVATSIVFQLRTGSVHGTPVFAPCCSMACAEAKRDALAAPIEAELQSIRRQSFQVMPLSKFGE